MPVFDISGSLKVIGDKAGNLEIRDPSGIIISPNATFLHFSGSAVSSVVTSSTGVILTLEGGSAGSTIDGGTPNSGPGVRSIDGGTI